MPTKGVCRITIHEANTSYRYEYVDLVGYLIRLSDNTLIGIPQHESKQIVIPEGVERLGTYALAGLYEPEIVLPASMRELEPEALLQTEHLPEITTAEGNPYFKIQDRYLLSGDGRVLNSILPTTGPASRAIHIPDSVEEINPDCFAVESKDLVIVPGEGITRLEGNLFSGCKSATLDVPATLKYIDSAVWSAVRLDIAENHPVYKMDGNWLLTADGKTVLYGWPMYQETIPDGVTVIAAGAFDGVDSRKEISLPLTLENVEPGAIKDPSLLRFRVSRKTPGLESVKGTGAEVVEYRGKIDVLLLVNEWIDDFLGSQWSVVVGGVLLIVILYQMFSSRGHLRLHDLFKTYPMRLYYTPFMMGVGVLIIGMVDKDFGHMEVYQQLLLRLILFALAVYGLLWLLAEVIVGKFWALLRILIKLLLPFLAVAAMFSGWKMIAAVIFIGAVFSAIFRAAYYFRRILGAVGLLELHESINGIMSTMEHYSGNTTLTRDPISLFENEYSDGSGRSYTAVDPQKKGLDINHLPEGYVRSSSGEVYRRNFDSDQIARDDARFEEWRRVEEEELREEIEAYDSLSIGERFVLFLQSAFMMACSLLLIASVFMFADI